MYIYIYPHVSQYTLLKIQHVSLSGFGMKVNERSLVTRDVLAGWTVEGCSWCGTPIHKHNLPSSVVGWLRRVSLGCETCLLLCDLGDLVANLGSRSHIQHIPPVFLPHSHRPDPLCGVMGRGSLCGLSSITLSYPPYLWGYTLDMGRV